MSVILGAEVVTALAAVRRRFQPGSAMSRLRDAATRGAQSTAAWRDKAQGARASTLPLISSGTLGLVAYEDERDEMTGLDEL